MKTLCILTIIFCVITLIYLAICFGVTERNMTDKDFKERQENMFNEEVTKSEEEYSKSIKVSYVINKLLMYSGPIFGLALGVVGLIVL